VLQPLPGDYNRNGLVDAADYIIWRKQVGYLVAPCSGADANCNGFVEVAEYQPWRTNFGRTVSMNAAFGVAGIPEPPTLVIVVATLFVVTRWRIVTRLT
jgi:hypothetical protein